MERDLFIVNSLLEKNDLILSRTEQNGFVDTSANAAKKSLISSNLNTREIVSRNRELAASYIVWRGSYGAIDTTEVVFLLICLSEIVNTGLSSSGLFRSWPLTGRRYGEEADIDPSDVISLLLGMKFDFSDTGDSIDQRLRKVAGLEWEIGIGPLHPFSDGCGRTSRYFSMYLSIVHGCPAILHRDRAEYYLAGSLGKDNFSDYYMRLDRVELRTAER